MKLKKIIKKTPLIVIFILLKKFFIRNLNSQSNENIIIDKLIHKFKIPNSFIEFGFSGWEFNCINLAQKDWTGLLIDGDEYNITIAQNIFTGKIKSKKVWIDLDSINYIKEYAEQNEIGILSIDVDGNDYWFLEKLISTKPAIIIIEFNVFFGLLPISIPYDSNFDRTKAHETWAYFGASITAMNFLANQNNYSLVEISKNGVNAFFIRNELLSNTDKILDPSQILKDSAHPDGTIISSEYYWSLIKHMPFVNVTESGSSCQSEGKIINN
jgi:hypothetical protein